MTTHREYEQESESTLTREQAITVLCNMRYAATDRQLAALDIAIQSLEAE
jgi:hypothetical protein